MPNDTENKMTDMTERATEALKQGAKSGQDAIQKGTQTMQNVAQQGAQTMQTMAKQGSETMTKAAHQGAQQMQTMGKAAQDMGRRTAEASMAGMAEFSRMFGDMKWPMMPDMEALMAAHRRNMETLSAANRVALEGAQTVAKRHMEIVQQTMQEMTETIRDLSSTESPQNRAAKQSEMVKLSYERAVTHMRELADLIQRSNGEALQMLNKRFAEAMDEVKALSDKTSANSRGV